MVKGFIDFQEGKIPFVIENYRMNYLQIVNF